MKSAYIQVLKRENELFDQITNKLCASGEQFNPILF